MNNKNIVMLNTETGHAVDVDVEELLLFIGPGRRIMKYRTLAKLVDGRDVLIRGYKFYLVFAER